MAEPAPLESTSTRWGEMVLTLLREGTVEEKRVSLEFLSLQASMPELGARAAFPIIQQLLFHAEPGIRYFAHKASDRLRELFPSLAPAPAPEPAEPPDEKSLSPKEILLRKIRLGSCYVVFEALERLTESKDPTLADPLLAYLKEERDPYKLAFLVKRLPRIPDPRIAAALGDYLDHPDFRVVANALEGLCQVDAPHLKDRFAALARAEDHRVRGAAIRALYPYDKITALDHLRQMLAHDNIAFQDTGLFTCKQLKGPGVDELLELALASRFPSIRLQALEMGREPLAIRAVSGLALLPLTDGQRERGLGISLLLGAALLLAISLVPRPALVNVFAVGVLALAILLRRSELEFGKGLASAALLGCLAWGGAGFLPLLGLLAVWVPLPITGSSETARLNRLGAWGFATLAVVVTHVFHDESFQALELVAGIMTPGRKITPGLAMAVGQVQTFKWVLFLALSAFLFFLLRLDRWFPQGAEVQAHRRRVLVAMAAGMLVLLAMLVSHVFALSLTMRVNGLGSPALIFKQLGE